MRIFRLLIATIISVSAFTAHSKPLECGQPPAERFQSLLTDINPKVQSLSKYVNSESWPLKVDEIRSQILLQNPALSSEYLDSTYAYLLCNLVKKDKTLKKDKDKEHKLNDCCDIKEYSRRVVDQF